MSFYNPYPSLALAEFTTWLMHFVSGFLYIRIPYPTALTTGQPLSLEILLMKEQRTEQKAHNHTTAPYH